MRLPFFIASRFVAGESFEKALPAIKTITDKDLFVTLDLLGEYVKEKDVAIQARDAYIDLVRVVSTSRDFPQQSNISIKLSMLGQKIDLDFCMENLIMLLDEAKKHNVFVRLDMEGSDITESTVSIFEAVYPKYPDHVGIVLQAYLKRTAKDIDRMCELNARVRICKGAYTEPADIAYQNMDEIRARFLEYAKKLIQHARYPGVATHDDYLINEVKKFVSESDIPSDRFEFQMLYGMRPDTQKKIREEGYNMRVYVPFGTEWVPYYTRRLKEKKNMLFVLRNLFRR